MINQINRQIINNVEWNSINFIYFILLGVNRGHSELFLTSQYSDFIVKSFLSVQIKLLIDICNSTKGVCIAGLFYKYTFYDHIH